MAINDEPILRREFESCKDEIWRELNRVSEKLEGPPHPGLENRVDHFLVEFRTLEKERDKQHQANRWRLNVIIALIAAMAAWLIIFWHR